jgi:hypothetical protein
MSVAAVSGLLAALIGMVWIIRAKQLRLGFNRRARGMRYFRLVSGASGQTSEAQRKEDKEEGAVREQNPDDAVER